ncbi:DUF2922 domain-containing protein [Fictibacillus enclensis]|jgi:hypothetical protein|uniref:DUF2922 domain-containing protein n=1 Tax=Fictibacillus enclensis TaxID=1017270 RepID=UPI0024BF69B0|nr:DUF2922 domain-containing protein [Fictibacillus enclensis]MDM5340724.1 DUF2922 domain-containing protein [Fictibacillus enclensis]WHY72152.1 DUF2922 domain-containing protein [Fictibacillus enclensis]
MAKTLELQFINEQDKTVTISLDSPAEPVDPAAVKAAMDAVIAQNIFVSTGGDFVKKKGARLTDRSTSDIVLP